MEENNNQIPKPTESDKENSKSKQLENSEDGWTVDDLMELCPSLTREEAIIAHRMGW